VLNQAKGRLSKDASLYFMKNHAKRIFRVFETAGTSLTIRDSLQCAELTYSKDVQDIYMLRFDENQIHA
jgi:hypothetical protein